MLVDKPRLDIILSNILSNAVKYTAENGNVKLTVSEKVCNTPNSNKYIFTIEDNGIGMSADVCVLKGKRVLLVEDNELNSEIAKDILEEYGIIADTAENGEIAVEYCRKAIIEGLQNYPDLILMDIQMSVMDGYEATRIIRSLMSDNERRVPIVALTANSFPEDKQKARDAGMNAHLEKPINRNVLEKALVTLLK